MKEYNFCINCEKYKEDNVCENLKYCSASYYKGKTDIENVKINVNEIAFDPDKYYIVEIDAEERRDIWTIAESIRNVFSDVIANTKVVFVPASNRITISSGEALNTTVSIGLDIEDKTLRIYDKEQDKEYSDNVLKAFDELLGNICPLGDYRLIIMRRFKH